MLIFIVVPLISAVQSQNNIKSEYYPSDDLQGWINISADNELKTTELRAVFTNSFVQTIQATNLINFISGQSANYSCTAKNCSDDYRIIDSANLSKTISLINNAVIGLKLNGLGINIKNFEFSFLSDASDSCINQLEIDIGGDNHIEWVNKKVMEEICGNQIKSLCNTGTFSTQGAITEVPYCEKIRLPEAPAFRFKAGIQKQSPSVFYDGLLLARIFDSSGQLVGDCNLSNPTDNYTQCSIDYSVKDASDYYLCVSYKENYIRPGESASSYNYKLFASQSGAHCGFLGDPAVSPEPVATYDITAYAKKYSGIGQVKINEDSLARQNPFLIKDYLNDYLFNKYSRDCSNNCIIPIEFKGINQKLIISNLFTRYDTQGIADISEKNIYILEKTPAKISFNYSILNLAKTNFKVPQQIGNYTLNLFLGATLIAEENISVVKRDISPIVQLFPGTVAVLNPTKFSVFLKPDLNVSDYTFKWDFGDGLAVETTTINNIEHTFDSINNYTVNIDLYKSNSRISSKSFVVNVQSPVNAINTTIARYNKYISNFKSQLDALPKNYKEEVDENIAIANIEVQINELGVAYRQAVSSGASDSDYINIMAQLVKLKVPTAVQPSEINNIKLIDDLDIVDSDIISDIFDDYGCSNNEACNNAIVKWSINNVNINVINKVLSVYYTDSIENILSEFEIKVSPKTQMDYKGYLIINNNLNDLIFDGEYDISPNSDDITGINLDLSEENTIKFAIADQVSIFNLPFYVSPELKELNVSSASQPEEKSLWVFVLLFVLLIVMAIIAYLFIKKWYRKNYESILFKNKNDINNLLMFIRNSKSKNIPESEIKNRLKKTGWKTEQINYALKKYSGKDIWPDLFKFKKKPKETKNYLFSNPFIKKPR